MSVYVTGMGIISAIGNNVAENLSSLQERRSGIRKTKLACHPHEIFAAPVNLSDEYLRTRFQVSNTPHSRTSLLGIAAVAEAWGSNKHLPNVRTAFIGSTSVGGMDKTEKYYRQVLEGNSADFSLVQTHDSGNTSEKIAHHFGIKGYINTLSTACSSAANALMLAARMLEHGHADRIVAGGSDPLTGFTISGFQSLMIYDEDWCKPFDENRNGLNLGEGAAYLVLENEKSISATGNKPLCLLKGWSNAADAYHQTASSPEGKGATLAMKNAIEKSGVALSDISYINAHGTGTKNNDLSESTALQNIFGKNIPPFSSTKAFTGHTLAAAGAIEAVYSVLSIVHQVLLPGLNYKTVMSETGLTPVTEYKPCEVNAVLSNSFGFGGNNTSLIFKKI